MGTNPVTIGDATIFTGDALIVLRGFPDESVQTCITSPPYWGLRDYGDPGQIGLEATPNEYVSRMADVFREVRRVLRDDGTLWLNLGDSYCASPNAGTGWESSTLTKPNGRPRQAQIAQQASMRKGREFPGLKQKDLVGIPWMVAFALRADRWYLRQDIIWSKPNPMPESVRDRCTKSHEYIFMLSKSARYFYDQDAIKEPASYVDIVGMDETGFKNAAEFDGKHGEAAKNGQQRRDKQRGHGRRHAGFNDRWDATERAEQCSGMRNKRSVWTVATQPYKDAHFATFPPNLIRPCVMAGAPPGGVVLDPFSGSGTTGMVALEEGRKYVGIELNPEYQNLAVERITPAAQQGRLIA